MCQERCSEENQPDLHIKLSSKPPSCQSKKSTTDRMALHIQLKEADQAAAAAAAADFLPT